MKILKRILLIALALILWTVFIGHGIFDGYLLRPLTSKSSPEAFIEAVQKKINDEFVGSFAMAFIEDGSPSKDYFYSIDEPVDQTTVYQVASVSKWISAYGVMKLVEQGKIDLDSPVENYLTRWQLPKSEFDHKTVTVRKLLSHSSGLVDDLGYSGFGPDECVQTIEESLIKAADAPWSEGIARIGYTPGTQYMYSGAGYTILQLLIEEVSGQPFQTYMTQNVFEPLQMHHSTFDLSEKPELKLAQLFKNDGSLAEPIKFTALAAASLYTCTEDLSKFLISNVAVNAVLKPETIALMAKPETFLNDYPIYGLGPHLYSQKDKISNIIGHDGSGAYLNTAARIDLNSKDGIIVIARGNYDLASAVADEWIFWKAGIGDYVVIQRNKPYLTGLLVIGYVFIIALTICRFKIYRPKV